MLVCVCAFLFVFTVFFDILQQFCILHDLYDFSPRPYVARSSFSLFLHHIVAELRFLP